jgi:hypothetical protein
VGDKAPIVEGRNQTGNMSINAAYNKCESRKGKLRIVELAAKEIERSIDNRTINERLTPRMTSGLIKRLKSEI